jgi:hypothetical protein
MVFFLLSKNIVINGVFFSNDIISEDKQFLSYQEFQSKYMISTNFLEYYGIVGAVIKKDISP